MENETYTRLNRDDGDFDEYRTQRSKKEGSIGSAEEHKRSISGGVPGRLSFLRSSAKENTSKQPSNREETTHNRKAGESSKPAIAHALRQGQGRKRKGSLRKAAMVGTGKLLRERRNSLRKPAAVSTQIDRELLDDETTPQHLSYENASMNSSSDSGLPPLGKSTSMDSSQSQKSHENLRALTSPLTNQAGLYASTTDDDESVSFFRPAVSSSGSSYSAVQLQPPGHTSPLQRRRSNRSGQQSLQTTVHSPVELELDDEWDYSETEWWGWVVLIATWMVFVVGMGSCLGVWSWAWDVGETPYAPPELEDDPTLPITGYYPALMVCTAVMAWVWVVVAWVGMKYFRHAKEA